MVLCNPFLGNRISKHAYNNTVIVQSVQSGIRNKIVAIQLVTRVEAGSNTTTVTLRVVGGDEKGSLKSETVKYGREYQGTRTRERLRWQGPPAYTNDRPVLS
jgi:hypothetical protein